LREDVLASEQVLHRGNLTEPTSLDPHKGDGVASSNIQRDLFEGLIIPAPDGSLVPGAAERWEVSADKKTYRFFLREDGRWSNGDPVTAGDFVYGLRRSADPATLSNYSMILSPIENADAVIHGLEPPENLGVEAESERVLVIRLKAPTPYFAELLTHSTTYPLHEKSVTELGRQFARPGNLIGNGAFVLDEWVVQSHIKLSKSPTYWDRENVRLETVFYYPIENLNTELKQYRAGELDWTDSLPYQQLNWVRENLPDEIHIDPYLGVYYFGFNASRPPFKDEPAPAKSREQAKYPLTTGYLRYQAMTDRNQPGRHGQSKTGSPKRGDFMPRRGMVRKNRWKSKFVITPAKIIREYRWRSRQCGKKSWVSKRR
jgi:oligopeptide transport system substrate-binding protein